MSGLPKFESVLRDGIAAGTHVGVQAAVSVGDDPAIDVVLGDARPGVAMAADTLMLWLSATKPVTAVCVGQLWERGRLTLDDPVARHVPEFAAHGKGHVTIRHLLTHTSGIRPAAHNGSREPWGATIAKVCDAPIEPGWVVGHTAGYHVASSWFVLGEIVRRVDGRPFERYVREELFQPLGMDDCWVGLPPERYAEYGDRVGLMVNTDPVFRTAHTWDQPAMAALCKPGGNGRGPARQLLRFYQMLLNGGSLGGVRIVSPQTVEAMTARARVGLFDLTFKHVMDWGLGFVVNNNQYGAETVRYGYGPHAGWRAYGHGGHQSSVAFADPGRRLAVALMFNGTPGEAAHDRRVRAALAALYNDLGYVGTTA